jgi:hypothetical protein
MAAFSISQSLATISLTVGLMGICGAVFSFLRFNNYKETVRLQDENIKALNDLLATHEKELARQKNEITALQARNQTLETLPMEAILKSLDTIQKTTLQILGAQANSKGGK